MDIINNKTKKNMSDNTQLFNSLHSELNFHESGKINEISRYCSKINGISIDIFEKKNGYGMELRWHTIEEKKALTEQMSKLEINWKRNDFVFYPWPRNLSTEISELKNRLKILFDIATASNRKSLNSETLLFLNSHLN